MRDGKTRRTEFLAPRDNGFEQWAGTLVVLEGKVAAGMEYPITQTCVRIGRGPDVDLEIDDEEMSSAHASISFEAGAFHLTDLGSTNGTLVNGSKVVTQELSHGDRIRVGGHVLQLVMEKREAAPRVYVLPDA
jgi:pSer/pThr/pTyr-binding forkhead associated (FHA) protein